MNNMKNLFKKSQNRLSTTLANSLSKPLEPPTTVASVTPNIYASGSVGLKPRDVLPPVPHSYPYHSIAILATNDGLLLRPNIEDRSSQATSHVRIAWGKDILVEELQGAGAEHDWSKAAFIHGVLGTVKLFSCEGLQHA